MYLAHRTLLQILRIPTLNQLRRSRNACSVYGTTSDSRNSRILTNLRISRWHNLSRGRPGPEADAHVVEHQRAGANPKKRWGDETSATVGKDFGRTRLLQSCTGSAPSCSYKNGGPEGTRLQLPGQFQTVTLATTDSPLDRDRCSLLAANAAAAAAAARSKLIGRSSRLRCLLCKPLGLDAVELDLLVDVPRIIDRLAPPKRLYGNKSRTRPQSTRLASC